MKTIRLTDKEIDCILNAISIANDEGYGPENFGKGDWSELIDKLESCKNIPDSTDDNKVYESIDKIPANWFNPRRSKLLAKSMYDQYSLKI